MMSDSGGVVGVVLGCSSGGSVGYRWWYSGSVMMAYSGVVVGVVFELVCGNVTGNS